MDKKTATAKVKAKYVVPIDEGELVIRMIEASGSIQRPDGASIDLTLRLSDPVVVAVFRKAARAAMLYWEECINNINATN